MSEHRRWLKNDSGEYVSKFGVVKKDNGFWVGLVKEGFGYRICGREFEKVRDAMIATEKAFQEGSPLPPIQFPAHIFC